MYKEKIKNTVISEGNNRKKQFNYFQAFLLKLVSFISKKTVISYHKTTQE